MTISLFDIPTATASYLENEVEVRVGQITGNLQPEEEGTYSVRVTNPPAPNGVRLTDLTLHITASPESVVTLIPPTGVLINARRTGDTSDPLLERDDLVNEMFVFFNGPNVNEQVDGILEVGERLDLEFGYHAEARGDATIACHIHASVDVDDLFPRGSGSDGSGDVTVIRGPQ